MLFVEGTLVEAWVDFKKKHFSFSLVGMQACLPELRAKSWWSQEWACLGACPQTRQGTGMIALT